MITLYGNPMLASDMQGLGDAIREIAYLILGLWLITFLLFLANVYLTFSKNSSSFRIVNAQILGVCAFLALVLITFGSSMARDNLGFKIVSTMVFLIPLMVVVHFICLLVSVRRRRRRLENVPTADTKEKQGQD